MVAREGRATTSRPGDLLGEPDLQDPGARLACQRRLDANDERRVGTRVGEVGEEAVRKGREHSQTLLDGLVRDEGERDFDVRLRVFLQQDLTSQFEGDTSERKGGWPSDMPWTWLPL